MRPSRAVCHRCLPRIGAHAMNSAFDFAMQNTIEYWHRAHMPLITIQIEDFYSAMAKFIADSISVFDRARTCTTSMTCYERNVRSSAQQFNALRFNCKHSNDFGSQQHITADLLFSNFCCAATVQQARSHFLRIKIHAQNTYACRP